MQGAQGNFIVPARREFEPDRPDYTAQEVMDTLMAQTNLPRPMYLRTVMGMTSVYVSGVGTKDVAVHISKNKFQVVEITRPSEIGNNFAKNMAFGSFSDIAESAMHDINAAVDQVAREAWRLFGKK